MRARACLLLLGLAGAAAGACASTKCEGDLDVVGAGCQASFDGTEAGLPACTASGVAQSAQRCGDLFALSHSDYAGITCYYDVSSHELVGARELADAAVLCGDSTTKDAGRTPSGSCSTIAQRTCP